MRSNVIGLIHSCRMNVGNILFIIRRSYLFIVSSNQFINRIKFALASAELDSADFGPHDCTTIRCSLNNLEVYRNIMFI